MLVSNEPPVMLLRPITDPSQGVLLALASTLAGNLFIVGSSANITVVDAAPLASGWSPHRRQEYLARPLIAR
jgi:Na+/H+ antiporter NhaD/arsenite permease-like protein